MKKMIFKKILAIIDFIEIQKMQRKDLQGLILKELSKENITGKEYNLEQILPYLFKNEFVKEIANGIDLTPSATIFSKADSNSQVEALSLFESLYHMKELRPFFIQLLSKPIHKVDFFSHLDEISYSLIMQSNLLFEEQDILSYNKKLIRDIQHIMKSFDNQNPLLSTTLCALYTTSIVSHENKDMEYRNQHNHLVDYADLHTILSIIPRCGVPNDRNETKVLQSFYKDTLFHECKHVCPVCGIDFPHMLIASHIKPFRDCAHLYEAIDHNNGLLLCRNHDYLFDQGYFSFDALGNIVLSEELQEKENNLAYAIDPDYHLQTELLTKERLLFLAYHRENIFHKV